jgi:hypothetical protein
MKSWFSKSQKVTAATARRVTGISTPFGGFQWTDPGPSERDIVRGLILFLEDRRVLYNPMILEVRSQVDPSIHQIRHECTNLLRQLGENAFAAVPIRAIREACRRFHDDANMEFRFFANRGDHELDAGFFAALGAFRATIGQQLALLAAHYDLDIDGDLAAVMPRPGDNRS